VNFLLLPLLLAYLLGRYPGVLVLFELHLQPVVDDSFLFFDGFIPSLNCLYHVLKLLVKILLVGKKGLDHVDLLLDAHLHVLFHAVRLANALFLYAVNLLVSLSAFLLAELFQEIQLLLLLLFFDLQFHQSLSNLRVGLSRLLSAKMRPQKA